MKKLRHWVHWFNQNLGFSKRETKSVVVLLCLAIVSLVIPSMMTRYFLQIEDFNKSKDSLIMAEWADSLLKMREKAKKEVEVPPQYFNPNTASAELLQSIGFSPYATKNIIKYRSKGGEYKVKKHLLKTYGIDSTLIKNKLWNYIQLPEKIAYPKKKKDARYKKPKKKVIFEKRPLREIEKINLNQASVDELKEIKGIGNWYAKCILDHKTNLGGYVSYDQLLEKCKLSHQVMVSIKERFVLNEKEEFPILDINSLSAGALSNHPYISNQLADQIVLYRLHHGDFQEFEDMKRIGSMTQETLARLAPYILIK